MYHSTDIQAAQDAFYRRARVAAGVDPDDAEAEINVTASFPPAFQSMDVCPDCLIVCAQAAAEEFLDRVADAVMRDPEGTLGNPDGLLRGVWVHGFAVAFTMAKWVTPGNASNDSNGS